jgi:sugar O-acyltransferase (sialic acid O-acetyltransferase NeuD family)
MIQDLVVYGTGGVGRQVVQIARDITAARQTWHVIGYLDDDLEKRGMVFGDLPVLGSAHWLQDHPATFVAVAIGSPSARWRVMRALSFLHHRHLATLVHPSAWLGERCTIGAGTLVYAGSVIDPDVKVGNLVLINKLCTLGHDATVGDYTTFAPGVNLGGDTHIAEGCDLGIGSATVQRIAIGEWSVVGAGAVVINDLEPNVTAVGVPAKVIKQRQPGWQEEL